MNNIEWKDGAVCYTDAGQWVLSEVKKTLKRAKGERRVGFEQALNQRDFKLNEIRTGDFIPTSDLDTEQKYNEVVEVFGLFGFGLHMCNSEFSKYKTMNFTVTAGGCCYSRHGKRQLTYSQIIAIGKLKRMMLEGESIERQSSYCRCKQVELDESKLPKFNAETPTPEVKEPKKHKPVVAQVMVDLMERMELGIKTYGEALRPNNGRDALQDAYEEALDLACYLKQAMIERDQEND